MQACILEKRGRDGVAVRSTQKPDLRDGFCLVRMLAASVNRVDLYMRDDGAGITHELPQIMGVDGVGEVAECAPGSALRPGQRVILYPYEFCGTCRYCTAGDQPLCETARIFGEHRDGTFADYILVPESSLLPLSDATDPEAAAALGVAYLTAWRMVFGKAPPQPGSTILIQGAGGGVALAAGQLARMAGARVIATTTGADKLEALRAEGFEEIDYGAGPTSRKVLEMTNGQGVDLAIDNVGGDTWAQSLRSLRRGGHLVTCGATTGGHPSAEIQRLFVRQLNVHGSTMGSLDEFRQLIACFEAGRIAPRIDSRFPLDRATEALDRLEHRDRFGKVVIRIADPSTEDSQP